MLLALLLAITPDAHTFSNHNQIRVKHFDLDLAVSFDNKQLAGYATLTLERREPASELILDTNLLDIQAVTINGAPAKFTLDKPDPILGAALHIPLAADATQVKIAYRTSPASPALHWLAPNQTAGGKLPYLYTTSWPINARGWIPLQDSPQVKYTFNAHITTPPGYLALMSAENAQDPPRNGDYTFRSAVPMPPHDLALAAASLTFRRLGPRTGVYAEPEIAAKAAHEYEDTERLLIAAEKICGKYRWGRYDLLVLPPGAPYGGMENPHLTFIAESTIVGDKSGAGTVAHEIAHSWSGNLVTNATWSDIWISEGITSYLTRRIEERVFGRKVSDMETYQDRAAVERKVADSRPEEQTLHPASAGKHPENLMGPIPYRKGALFMWTAAATAGGRQFHRFLRTYFDHFAFGSVTGEEWAAYARQRLPALKRLPMEEWLNGPGIPSGAYKTRARLFEQTDKARERWLKGGPLNAKDWHPRQWAYFMDRLGDTEIKPERLAVIDKKYNLTAAINPGIYRPWLVNSIKRGYMAPMPRVESILAEGKDRATLIALFRALPPPQAAALFSRNRAKYSDGTAAAIEKLLVTAVPANRIQ